MLISITRRSNVLNIIQTATMTIAINTFQPPTHNFYSKFSTWIESVTFVIRSFQNTIQSTVQHWSCLRFRENGSITDQLFLTLIIWHYCLNHLMIIQLIIKWLHIRWSYITYHINSSFHPMQHRILKSELTGIGIGSWYSSFSGSGSHWLLNQPSTLSLKIFFSKSAVPSNSIQPNKKEIGAGIDCLIQHTVNVAE